MKNMGFGKLKKIVGWFCSALLMILLFSIDTESIVIIAKTGGS
jgi:hypothetical protein